MVEFNEFESKIPKLLTDVKKFTVDELGFRKKDKSDLSLKVHLYTKDKLEAKVAKITPEVETEGMKAFLDWNGNIYLNYEELNDELYQERTLGVFLYFYPIAYTIEETPYGKEVKGKREILPPSLVGIGKAVELDGMEEIKGYRLEELKDELGDFKSNIIEDYGEEAYDAYKLCRKLQERAQNFEGEADEKTRKRIIKAAILTSGIGKDFEANWRNLESLTLPEIYAKASPYSISGEVLLPKVLREVDKLANDVKFKALDSYQWRDVKPKMEELSKEMKIKGFPEDLRNKINGLLNSCSTMDPIEAFRDELKKDTSDLMEEISEYCMKSSKRPIKIKFR